MNFIHPYDLSAKASIEISRAPKCAFMNPQVGDGVTINYWSDSHAATVIKRTKSTVVVQRDIATLDKDSSSLKFDVGGFAAHVTGTQVYDYERDENGATYTFSRRANGKWVAKGDSKNGRSISMGRTEHYDYNF